MIDDLMRQHVRIDRRGISYLDSARAPVGAPPRADARVVLFLHAFPMNAEMWVDQVGAAPAGWRFLAPDLRGFGESAAEAARHLDEASGLSPSLDDYARDMLALLDQLGVERVVVVGLSMGGYTAFALMRLAAGRVAGLVLANTKAEADSAEARQGRRDMLVLLDQGGVGAVADRMLPRLLSGGARARAGLEARVRAVAVASSPEGVRAAILRMMNRPDSTPLLGRIACPTLVVASSEDEVTPVAEMRGLRQRIDGADLVVLSGAGHLSNIENPGEFTEAIRHFLAVRFGG